MQCSSSVKLIDHRRSDLSDRIADAAWSFIIADILIPQRLPLGTSKFGLVKN
jgi:hypothetical protein